MSTGTPPAAAPALPDLVALARDFLGDRYVYGATGPTTFDCSGLTQHVYKLGGISIPRTSEEQYAFGTPISAAQAQPGDLVFFAGSDGTAAAPGHVGIYIGGGQMIDAPHTGTVVQIGGIGGNVGFRRMSVAGAEQQAVSSTIAAAGNSSFVSALGDVFNDVTGGLLTWPAQFIGAVSDIDQWAGDAYGAAKLFFQPSTYVRIGAGIAGTVFLILGIICLTREAKGAS